MKSDLILKAVVVAHSARETNKQQKSESETRAAEEGKTDSPSTVGFCLLENCWKLVTSVQKTQRLRRVQEKSQNDEIEVEMNKRKGKKEY